MIEVERISKRFGPVNAVDDLSFTVRPGRVTGFLGPNGAGKTTTMRIILGLVLISLRGRRAGVKMGAGCPPTPVFSLGLRARGLVWRRGPTWKGHALLLRARRSEFRFPTEAPGHPVLVPAGDGGEPR